MAKAPDKSSVTDALGAAMKRREAKLAIAAETEAKAKASKAAVANAKPVPQDHKAPTIGAKDIMAGFESAMKIVHERRLQALARKYPELAALMEAHKAQAHDEDPYKQPDPAPDLEPKPGELSAV